MAGVRGIVMGYIDAQLYIIRTERTTRPDVKIHFRGIREDLAEQALVGMAQVLADTMQAPIRIVMPMSQPQTISPSEDK